MRPAAFSARKVSRCVSQRSRLCTWMRSNFGRPQSRRESAICRLPVPSHIVHTFVAENSARLSGTRASPWPITASDEPYIGEESTMPPPRAKNSASTFARASRNARSSPTLNVIQVPRPMAGICSPVDGMARMSFGPGAAARAARKPAAIAPAPASEARIVRRVCGMWRRSLLRCADSRPRRRADQAAPRPVEVRGSRGRNPAAHSAPVPHRLWSSRMQFGAFAGCPPRISLWAMWRKMFGSHTNDWRSRDLVGLWGNDSILLISMDNRKRCARAWQWRDSVSRRCGQ